MGLKTKDVELTIKANIASSKKSKKNMSEVLEKVDLKGLSVSEKYKTLAKRHKELFDKENEPNPKFIPLVCYKYKNEHVISLYPSQIQGGKDIYIEFRSKDYTRSEKIDNLCDEHTLWKWIHNPEYDTEYEKSKPHNVTGDRYYYIPVDELINVTELHKKPVVVEAKQESIEFEDENKVTLEGGAGTDALHSSMTIRDYAAIKWQKPVSRKKWLNELITNTFK